MKRDPLRRWFEQNPGTFLHASRLLRVLADATDDPDAAPEDRELHMQAVEVARALLVFDRIAKRRRN